MTSTTTPAKTNRFGAKCATCGGWVHAEAGILTGSRALGWKTVHAGECPPAKAPAKNAEVGYYVRPADGKAVKVEQSKRHADRTYGKVLNFPADGSRPSWDYTPGAGYSVADLRPMTAADAAEMGLAHGHCVKCCAPLGGETLSAAVSALIGYGASCAKNMGWPYPTKVAEQRALLASAGAGR